MLKSPSNDAASLRGKLSVRCTAWRAWRKNTLLGFASIRIAELDLTIYDVAVHAKNDSAWAQLPSKPWVRDGAVVTDDNGKTQYSVILEFGRKEVRDAFSRAVIDAVVRFDPHGLAMEEPAT
jgi:hypothetical protein